MKRSLMFGAIVGLVFAASPWCVALVAPWELTDSYVKIIGLPVIIVLAILYGHEEHPVAALVLTALMYGALGGLGHSLWRRAYSRRESVMPRCAKCGYELAGNVSGVCPECGTPVQGR